MRRAALSSTELAGRGAGRGGSSSAVVIGRTLSGSAPAATRMSRTNPYQVVAPWLVTWKMPGTRADGEAARMAGARSAVKVGQPRWSSTKASSRAVERGRAPSCTMLRPVGAAHPRRAHDARARRVHRDRVLAGPLRPAVDRLRVRVDPTRGTARPSCRRRRSRWTRPPGAAPARRAGVGDPLGAQRVDVEGPLGIALAGVDRRPGAGVEHDVGPHAAGWPGSTESRSARSSSAAAAGDDLVARGGARARRGRCRAGPPAPVMRTRISARRLERPPPPLVGAVPVDRRLEGLVERALLASSRAR